MPNQNLSALYSLLALSRVPVTLVDDKCIETGFESGMRGIVLSTDMDEWSGFFALFDSTNIKR